MMAMPRSMMAMPQARRGLCMRLSMHSCLSTASASASAACPKQRLTALLGEDSFTQRDFEARLRACGKSPEEVSTSLHAIFSLVDRRGSGVLSLPGVAEAIKAIKQNCPLAHAALDPVTAMRHLELADSNNDGVRTAAPTIARSCRRSSRLLRAPAWAGAVVRGIQRVRHEAGPRARVRGAPRRARRAARAGALAERAHRAPRRGARARRRARRHARQPAAALWWRCAGGRRGAHANSARARDDATARAAHVPCAAEGSWSAAAEGPWSCAVGRTTICASRATLRSRRRARRRWCTTATTARRRSYRRPRTQVRMPRHVEGCRTHNMQAAPFQSHAVPRVLPPRPRPRPACP